MPDRADLHIHTTASDGAFTPTQVVQAAADGGLAAVAITDHDTVGGIDEALSAGGGIGVEVVPGIEISATSGEKTEVHVLGYFIDYRNEAFRERLDVLRNSRWERGREIVERLNAVGVGVSFERVLELARGGAVGRPHVARAICEVGAAYSIDSAFGKFLIEGAPAFVPRLKVAPFEAIDLIIAAGGVACCAHAAKLNREDLLIEMIEQGMKAIEVYHPDHGGAVSRHYAKFAEKHGLIATGGSDAHCLPGGKTTAVGDITVAREIVAQLKTACSSTD